MGRINVTSPIFVDSNVQLPGQVGTPLAPSLAARDQHATAFGCSAPDTISEGWQHRCLMLVYHKSHEQQRSGAVASVLGS